MGKKTHWNFAPISSVFSSYNFFFIVKTLSHDTLTANHNTDETNETNTTTTKNEEKNTKIDVHFTQNAGAIVYGIHDGYKILPQLLWYSLPLFYQTLVFIVHSQSPFWGRVKLTRLLRWNIRVWIDDDFAFIIITIPCETITETCFSVK